MSRHKPGLTHSEHVELGPALDAMREELVRMIGMVSAAYPVTSRQTAALKRARVSVDMAIRLLDNAFACEHPEHYTGRAYYPEPARRPPALSSLGGACEAGRANKIRETAPELRHGQP